MISLVHAQRRSMDCPHFFPPPRRPVLFFLGFFAEDSSGFGPAAPPATEVGSWAVSDYEILLGFV